MNDRISFIEKYASAAMEQQQKYGIPASVTLAQACVESNSGTSRYATEGNNYFGVKGTWNGQYILGNDDRNNEKFKKYDTVEQSFEDHSRVLMLKRYSACLQYDSTDHLNWIKGIKAAGYATDPTYVATVEGVIAQYGLEKYDQMALRTATQPIGYARGQKSNTAGSSQPLPVKGQDASTAETVVPAATYFFPVDGQSDLVMSDGFGKSPVPHRTHVHTGIDLVCERGTAIRSTEAGVVVAVKSDMTEHDSDAVRKAEGNIGGNYVVVEYPRANGGSYRVSYCHLTDNGVAVHVGDKVDAGQVIGYAGSTGNSTGPHLHLTVKKGQDGTYGDAMNPLDYLAEIAVRGSLQGTVQEKGTKKDLLAGRLTNVDTTPTPHEVLLAQQGGTALTDEQRQNADKGATLAAAIGSNDPKDMLAYLMGRNNDRQQGDNLFSALLSSLFMSAMAMAMQLDRVGSNEGRDVSDTVPQQTPETEEQKSVTLIHRQRESVNAEKAKELAMMNFDAEFPEQQSQQQSQRLA